MVTRDIAELHDHTFPDDLAVVRRRHETQDWWILPVGIPGMVGMVAMTYGVDQEAPRRLVLLGIAGVGSVGLVLASARWRFTELNDATATSVTAPTRPIVPSRWRCRAPDQPVTWRGSGCGDCDCEARRPQAEAS